MYLTFTEYQQMGGKAESAAFPRLEYRARKQIDRYTQERVKPMAESEQVPEAVKRCMTEIINIMHAADPTVAAASPSVSGFSNDGYSESYKDPVTVQTIQANIFLLIYEYLTTEKDGNGTPLLYMGVEK